MAVTPRAPLQVSPAPAKPSVLLSPPALLVMLGTFGLLALVLSPYAQIKLGLFTYDHWFLDTWAILAANDAVQMGRNPWVPNPLDFLNRAHCYSHWWFVLGPLGITRAQNFLVGSSWTIGFVAAFYATVRPKLKLEAVWYAALLVSPPILLAIMRGNNDLVVFIVLAAGGLALAANTGWRVIVAIASVALAAGLKFYPAVAVAGLLVVRPGGRLRWTLLLAVVVVTFVGLDVLPDLRRATIPVSINVYSFGGPLLLQDFGVTGKLANVLTAVVLGAGGLGLAFTGRTRGLGDAATGDGRTRFLFAVAAVMLVACFVAGISYAYRWVFALWLAPWLWARWKAGGDPLARWVWAGSCLLLTLCLWCDGLFCLVVNLLPGPIPVEKLDGWQVYWRYASQPLNWLLMILLTGWLVDLAWQSLGAMRNAESESAPRGDDVRAG